MCGEGGIAGYDTSDPFRIGHRKATLTIWWRVSRHAFVRFRNVVVRRAFGTAVYVIPCVEDVGTLSREVAVKGSCSHRLLV